MSYATITQCTRDTVFQDRVVAGAMKEAIASVVYSETQFADELRRNNQLAVQTFIWPLSIDNEDDYAYAVDTGNENPGGDPGVISDAQIQAGIQTHWPLTEDERPQSETVGPSDSEGQVPDGD